ncbi:hypothetical protein ACTFIV_010963 [Dictyostelium citrinum]
MILGGVLRGFLNHPIQQKEQSGNRAIKWDIKVLYLFEIESTENLTAILMEAIWKLLQIQQTNHYTTTNLSIIIANLTNKVESNTPILGEHNSTTPTLAAKVPTTTITTILNNQHFSN